MPSATSLAHMEGLRKLVAAELGLQFPKQRWDDLERGLVAASVELRYESPRAFIRSLLSAPTRPEQVDALANSLTVGETYFFRDAKSFEALEMRILPDLISRRRKSRRLKIWSAGCATGEEPYSIAILLSRLLPDPAAWSVAIIATDVSTKSLEKAIGGTFGNWSFRDVPTKVRSQYFRKTENGRFELLPHIRRMVTFSHHNLVQDPFPSITNNTGAVDLILCRNVLMYFTSEAEARVVSRFRRCLVDGGWLIVSPCEVSPHIFSGFTPITVAGVTCYQGHSAVKSEGETDRLRAASLVRRGTVVEGHPKPALGRERGGASARPADSPAAAAVLHPLRQETAPADSYDQVLSLFVKGYYGEAERKILSLMSSDAPDTRMAGLLARLYANQGRLADACEWTERAIAQDKLNPDNHYLHAVILEAQGRTEEAAKALKRLLYLDPGFVLGHFNLGNLVRRQGRAGESQKHFRNALSLLKSYRTEQVVAASEGLTAGRLIEIIRSLSARGRNKA